MTLTGQQEQAAALVAADSLTDDQICSRVGLKSRKTLWNWRQKPEFRARVEALRAELRELARKSGIAVKEHRLAALDRRHRLLEQVIEARAQEYRDQAPGSDTGLLVPELVLVKVYEAGELHRKGCPGYLPSDEVDPDEDVRTDFEGQPHGGALKRDRKRKPPKPLQPPDELRISELLERGTLGPGDGQAEDGGGDGGGDDGEAWEIREYAGGEVFSAKRSIQVLRYALDRTLLAELRALELQSARETGQLGVDENDEDLAQIEVKTIRYVQPAPQGQAA